MSQLQACANWRDPIVIVGAGPVGMCAALGLSYYGVPCIVLDDAEGTAIEGSRAIFMERHTLEVLGAWSPVGQQMAELGMTLTGGRVFFRKTELYRTLNAPPEQDMRYPRFVNMPQNLLERLQYEALQHCPCCEVRWQHKVTCITQDDEEVCLEVTTPRGVEEIRTQFVIAADGPRSTLRHLLNLPFPGESRDHHFLILDVKMELETPRERWFWFDPPFNPGRTALLHPQPDSIYRIDYQLPSDEDLELAKQPESLHKRIVETVGERPYEIVWKSIYTYQQRALQQFKLGRVIFVGDAAHLMSPFGGRGLNSGIQDVWNLMWKLVLVRAGLAPQSLLDTYHDERHAAALENLRLTADTMQFLVPPTRFARWRRDMILRASLPFKFMRRYINAGHMSNPFSYRNSCLISEEILRDETGLTKAQLEALKRFRVGPIAGSLAPTLVLKDATTGERISLLDHFGKGFVVLYFCETADEGIQTIQRVQSGLPDVPKGFYVVTTHKPTKPVPDDVHILLDEDSKGAATYASGSCTLYLVRPDRHIAARRYSCDLQELPMLFRIAINDTERKNVVANSTNYAR